MIIEVPYNFYTFFCLKCPCYKILFIYILYMNFCIVVARFNEDIEWSK